MLDRSQEFSRVLNISVWRRIPETSLCPAPCPASCTLPASTNTLYSPHGNLLTDLRGNVIRIFNNGKKLLNRWRLIHKNVHKIENKSWYIFIFSYQKFANEIIDCFRRLLPKWIETLYRKVISYNTFFLISPPKSFLSFLY